MKKPYIIRIINTTFITCSLICFSIISMLSSCDGCNKNINNTSQNKILIYKNIYILADMSNRLNNNSFPYPVKDVQKIKEIKDMFIRDCVKPGQKIGDRSSISFCLISNNNFNTIDLSSKTNISIKQQYVNSTGIHKNNGLKEDLDKWIKSIEYTYANTKILPGMDLIQLLLDKSANGSICKKSTIQTDGKDTNYIQFQNIAYIFTDGYLEYKNPNSNRYFYFSDTNIKAIRNFCEANQLTPEEALNTKPKLGLPRVFHKNNKLITLRIRETHERDWLKNSTKYNNIPGLRDNEILREVWYKWAKDSGFVVEDKETFWETYQIID